MALGALGFLFGLDLRPQAFDLLRCQVTRVAKDMRMAPDQFLVDRLDDVAEIERALLLRHARVEDDLEQEIAELFAQVIEVAARDRVSDLVGFLDGVRRDGSEILLEVPRAAGLGRPQALP